ncbi:TPR-like protein [Serendipita vermifera]|nr:TPR-like protein [Serendipita vermifera]
MQQEAPHNGPVPSLAKARQGKVDIEEFLILLDGTPATMVPVESIAILSFTDLLNFQLSAELIGAVKYDTLTDADFAFDALLEQHILQYIHDQIIPQFDRARQAAQQGIDAAQAKVDQVQTVDKGIAKTQADIDAAFAAWETKRTAVTAESQRVIDSHNANISRLQRDIDNAQIPSKAVADGVLRAAEAVLTSSQYLGAQAALNTARGSLWAAERSGSISLQQAKNSLAAADIASQTALDASIATLKGASTAAYQVAVSAIDGLMQSTKYMAYGTASGALVVAKRATTSLEAAKSALEVVVRLSGSLRGTIGVDGKLSKPLTAHVEGLISGNHFTLDGEFDPRRTADLITTIFKRIWNEVESITGVIAAPQQIEVHLLHQSSTPPNNLYSMLFFKDITVELASPDDSFLTDSSHLALELNQDGRVVDKANLLSRESSRRIWDADKHFISRKVTGESILSVSMQLDDHDRQLVGSIELSSTKLHETVGTEFETSLISHENYPSLILRTKVSTIENIRENIQEPIPGTIQQNSGPRENDTVQNMFSEGVTAYRKFERHGKLEDLEQAISKFEVVANVTLEDDPNLPRILGNLGLYLRCRFEQLGRIADINESIERLEKAASLTGDNDPDRPVHSNNLGNSFMRRFKRFETIGDIDSAIIHLQIAVNLTPDEHPDKPSYLSFLGFSLKIRFERFEKIGDIDSAIIHLQMAVNLTPDEHPDKPSYLSNLGDSLETRFERFGKVGDIDSAIIHHQMAINLTPDEHPDKPSYLSNLGDSLETRFERFGKVGDIDSAIIHHQMAVNLSSDEDPDKPMYLSNLGSSLEIRFKQFEKIGDIDSAIIHHQMAVNLTPDEHPAKPMYLGNLASSLETRFNRFIRVSDMDSAIIHKQMAISLTPDEHPNKPHHLNTLGSSLLRRFERFGKIGDMDGAIIHHQMAVTLTPDEYPDKPMYLSNLGTSLLTRFERFGKVTDIDNAIIHNQMAVNLTPDEHPGKPMYLSRLGLSLQRRFERFGKVGDIDSAIIHHQMAVNLTPDEDPYKHDCFSNLGISLHTRFEQFGKITDIDNAIIHNQMAISLTLDGDPNKPGYLSNLGNSLHAHFERFGKVGDIDNAIIHKQMAVSLTPDDHPDKPMYLGNLGNSLKTRFERFGVIGDIDSAIIHHHMAVTLTPDEHPYKPSCLSNLGNSLHERFQRFGKVTDIDNAIIHLQMAVSLTPDEHPDKPIYLSNLGNTLHAHFEQFGKVSDIDSAIIHHQMAISLTPDEHPSKPMHLSNLGNSLHARFERFGEVTDIDRTIIHLQMAISLTPDEHPEKPMYLGKLGSAFNARFLHLQAHEDAKAAVLSFSTSAQSSIGHPGVRFDAAQQWISVASLIQHESLLIAYECAIGLMPLVAWLGLSVVDRHEHLIEIGEVARDAAAAAITLEKYDKAIEWLEQGRSIVWNQFLQLRTPVDELHTVNSDLADRLLQVSRLLIQGVKPNGGMMSIEEQGQRYRALTVEWESIIDQVRSLPNFQDFLKPLQISRLRDAAKGGPVVVVNIAEKRCDALALVSGSENVLHIPLPKITYERATQLQTELKDVLYSSGMRTRGDRAAKRVTDEEGDKDCKEILAELWNGLVKPILDSLEFSPHPDSLPRIWWCPTGPLAFLPIHAAGICDPGSFDSQISDYVISSYTPTLSTLLEKSSRTVGPRFKLLSVIQPSAPGGASIPNTKKELECIKRRLVNRKHDVLKGPQGIKSRVIRGMKESNWVHLACHGSQRQDQPTKSGLILEDGHLTLEEIIKLDLPNAEFAFLSACQTTTGDEALSEEAVHIASGMLLAGYRGVVATMWSIQDDIAPKVADDFYRHIMADKGRPDSRKAAEALHYSIQRLRKKRGIALTSWIPFVHIGI